MVRLFVCISYSQVKFYVELEGYFELESQSLPLNHCLAISESTGLHSLGLQKHVSCASSCLNGLAR